MNIEIMRNTLYKAYLDDFAKFCNKLGGSTAAVMGDLLSFEVCMQGMLCVTYDSHAAYLVYSMHSGPACVVLRSNAEWTAGWI